MANITREERIRRQEEAKRGSEFAGPSYEGVQETLDRINAFDERAPDRRPATVLSIDTDPVTVAEDNRQFAGDQGKALNQMVGRAAITENHDPMPSVTLANNPPPVANPVGAYAGEGDEVQLLRGYVPADAQVGADGQATKRLKGEILRLPSKEAKKLVNIGAAKFTEAD
jgi:hypothetical protein